MRYALCFLAAFGLFVHGASPTVSFEDTGEMVGVSFVLGVTHPPGYPWLTMLGRLFLFLPLGDPAFRMNVMSAVLGAAAVTAVFALARLFIPKIPRLSGGAAALAPIAAAGALAFSKTLWWQSSIAEKYTLSIALMSLTLLAMARAWLAPGPGRVAGAFFLGGLALSHHLHGLYLIPALALLGWRSRPSRRAILLLLLLYSMPMCAKAVAVGIRAGANPPLNWGVPDRAGRLAFYLAARQYRFIMLSNKGAADFLERLVAQGAVMPAREFGPALALAVPGAAALASAAPGLALGAAATVAANFAFALAYPTPEIERYYLLTYAILAVLIGLGAAVLVRVRPAWGLAGALLLAVPAAVNSRTSPRDRHYLAHDFALNQLAPIPDGSILICEGDDQSFPLSYRADVADGARGIHILPMPFLCWKPAYLAMRPHNPGVAFPRFNENPGVHLPTFIAANSPRFQSYYTSGCTGTGSEKYLVPRGAVFRAHSSPEEAAASAREFPRLPFPRLRGAMDAARWNDSVSVRAVTNYTMGMAFRGAQALERGNLAEAERWLRPATLLPADRNIHAAALTHLGMTRERQGRKDGAETLYREAVSSYPDFAPALVALARLMTARGEGAAAFPLLTRATRQTRLLSRGELAELARLLNGNP